MSLVKLLSDFGGWNWLLAAVILMALETIVPGVHFVWFGVAATLVGLLALTTAVTWKWQLVIFAVLSVASAFVARRLARADHSPSDVPDLNVQGAQYIGRTVTVEAAIRGGRGKVKVGDTLWQAEGPDLPEGTRVKVTGVKDTVLVVQRD